MNFSFHENLYDYGMYMCSLLFMYIQYYLHTNLTKTIIYHSKVVYHLDISHYGTDIGFLPQVNLQHKIQVL